MARTGTNATGTGVGPAVFDWHYVLGAVAVFGSYVLIADAGQPDVAFALAIGTLGLFLLKTDAGKNLAETLQTLANTIGG